MQRLQRVPNLDFTFILWGFIVYEPLYPPDFNGQFSAPVVGFDENEHWALDDYYGTADGRVAGRKAPLRRIEELRNRPIALFDDPKEEEAFFLELDNWNKRKLQ